MPKIPFEKQRLPVNSVEQIEHKIAQGEAASGDELLDAIEQSHGQHLDDRLRDVIRRFSVSAVKRPGRPSNCKGREDFAMKELDARYRRLLFEYENEAARPDPAHEKRRVSRRTTPPSKRAYQNLAQKMAKDLGNIDWLALRNKHSKWKNGHNHSASNHIDSEDYDAEIDRRFPAPKRRS
jgi:hypothetical protein